MENIRWKSSDNSLEYLLEFKIKHQLVYTHLGKSYPKHTQCLIYRNGLLQHFETIVKHAKDKDDEKFALKLVGEKCLKKINNKWVRGEVRVELDNFISKHKVKK